MTKKNLVGQTVKLVTFNGSKIAPADVDPDQNFWKLVGSEGRVSSVDPPKYIGADRILVVFDLELDSLDLPNHNNPKNALWIKKQDLLYL